MNVKRIKNRIYNDYFMKSRLKEYDSLIKSFIDNNYEFITITDFNKLNSKGKFIIIRHDIDSDPKIARKMFEIEKKYGVKTTYYFRKCTFDLELINQIHEYGSLVGYHYEELSSYIKKNKLKNVDEINKCTKIAENILCDNINNISKLFGFEIETIASHGDFINRKYNISNTVLFGSVIKKKFPKIIEAYDDRIEKKLDFRASDTEYPVFWKPNNPKYALDNNCKKVLLLIHTRWWERAPLERVKMEIKRIFRK